MLCMRSKTKKANKIREYYLSLEKLIDKYKDTMIQEKDNKIRILENDLKKEVFPLGNYSYIIQEKDEIKVYNLLNGEFKELVKDIDVVFNESFTIDKYNWILKFKERYLDFNKRYTDIAGRLDICALDDEAEDEDSIDITEEEARSDGGLEEEYLATDEDEYEDEDEETL